MNSFLTEWSKDLSNVPFGPLGIIAMAGCEELGNKINTWLLKWQKLHRRSKTRSIILYQEQTVTHS